MSISERWMEGAFKRFVESVACRLADSVGFILDLVDAMLAPQTRDLDFALICGDHHLAERSQIFLVCSGNLLAEDVAVLDVLKHAAGGIHRGGFIVDSETRSPFMLTKVAEV